MKKIERSDILDLESYENAREHMRSSVIELKKNRRLFDRKSHEFGLGKPTNHAFSNPRNATRRAHSQ
ncbi:MAG: DUF3501 family protein [Myxococcales bacterium]|nr:MAG: DUF3501 family protein [Myxococcales bacterium]